MHRDAWVVWLEAHEPQAVEWLYYMVGIIHEIISIELLVMLALIPIFLGGKLHGWFDNRREIRRYGHPLINVPKYIGFSVDTFVNHVKNATRNFIKFLGTGFLSKSLVPLIPSMEPAFLISGGIIAGWFGYKTIKSMLKACYHKWQHDYLEAKGMHFITADNRERYRLTWWGPDGNYLYDRTSYEDRKKTELNVQTGLKIRNLKIYAPFFMSFVAVLICAILIVKLKPPVYVLPVYAVVAMSFGVKFAPEAFYTYLRTAAWMHDKYIHGAIVDDPKPERVGRRFAEQHTAHGSAAFSDAAEAARKMSG